MRHLGDFVRGNVQCAGTVGAVFLVCALTLVVINVVSRRFGYPIPETYILTGLLMAVVAALAVSYAESKHEHVAVTVIGDRLGRRPRFILNVFTSVITLACWIALFWGSVGLLIERWSLMETTDVLKISMVPFRLVWVYGLLSWCFVVLVDLIQMLKNREMK